MKRLTLAMALIIATIGIALAQAPATGDPHHPPQAASPAPQLAAPQSETQPGQTPQSQAAHGQMPGGMMNSQTMHEMMQGMMKTMQGMMQMMQRHTQADQMQPQEMRRGPMRPPQQQDGTMMNCPMMRGTTDGAMQGLMQMMQGMMQMMQGQMQSGAR